MGSHTLGFGDGKVLMGRSKQTEKPPERIKFKKHLRDFDVSSRGETYFKGTKDLSSLIVLFSCDSVKEADVFYKLFCNQIHFMKHRDKDAVKTPYLISDRKNKRVHLLIEKSNFTHYQKPMQYLAKVCLMYTYNEVVLEKLFNIYKNFIATYDMHIMEKKVFNIIDIDKIDRAMLYYSQPEKLKVVSR
jgi:hypothetical protein